MIFSPGTPLSTSVQVTRVPDKEDRRSMLKVAPIIAGAIGHDAQSQPIAISGVFRQSNAIRQ